MLSIILGKQEHAMFRSLQQQSSRSLSITPTLRNGPEVDLSDPKQLALHKLYRPERITPLKRGLELLKTPSLNKTTVRLPLAHGVLTKNFEVITERVKMVHCGGVKEAPTPLRSHYEEAV
ncbi:hypothetical protein NECAME_17628 [Necator americanus]|uniref:Uncharacterized protein n=1 Tax=Necator americanus TaxID=51031 RepID=W2TNX7_NECAM|nr:hypothetical protein NECAME_17628 [Necator americanus]ETN82826.1 hypothetical protein NECAME_17628 [Necator americanus]